MEGVVLGSSDDEDEGAEEAEAEEMMELHTVKVEDPRTPDQVRH